jgi:hypothetical protein
MQTDRYSRWIQASVAAAAVEPFMMPIVQGLGRLDCRLISEDARFSHLPEQERSSMHESTLLTDRFMLSYLWVLGAYELARTLDQRCRTNPVTMPESFRSRLTALKCSMERLRIPLAKMERSRRFPTDSAIAYPALRGELGIAWHVAQDTYITRHELSDTLLDCLTELKAPRAATSS